MERASSPITVDTIKEILEEVIPDEIEGIKYPRVGEIKFGLFKKEEDDWVRISSASLPGIRMTCFFLNANIGLDNKWYGDAYSLKDKYAIVGYDYDDRPIYDRSIKYNTFTQQSLNSFKDHILSNVQIGNKLVCDESGIIERLEDFEQIPSPTDINYGNHPELKDFLLKETGSRCVFYCRNTSEPITGVIRIRENSSLFYTYVPEEWCYRCKYALTDGPYQELLEAGLHSSSHFPYIEYVLNLSFGSGYYTIPIWQKILGQLRDEHVPVIEKFLLDKHRDSRIHGDYQVGVYAGLIKFPSLFLSSLRYEIIDNYRKKKERDEWQKEQELERERKRKEEEERNKDFNIKYSHIRDTGIVLRDSHYFLNSNQLLGVTKIVANFFPQFDADYWAGVKAPLMGKTKEQLLREWERKGIESAEAGTKLHQRIDAYYHHKEINTVDKDFSLFKQFEDAYRLNPYRSEWAIYDEETKIAGVIDMLDYSNGEYILYDWKRSDKIVEGGRPIQENKFGEFGLRPIDNVPNTDYWHYALQLSFYRYILEKNYGIRVKESRLVVLHPSLKLPVVLTVPYMIDEVNKIIEVMKI